MSVGILGSGFGLYGYLPAFVAGLGQPRVTMPARYRTKLLERPVERQFDDHVDWVERDEQVLAAATTLVLALRPADQVDWVRQALGFAHISRFVLEKPVAPVPTAANEVLASLAQAGRGLRIGFTLAHTVWAGNFATWLRASSAAGRVRFDWRFQAHHYATSLETWKRRPTQGGGALNFYGIHLIALLAELGYSAVGYSRVTGDEADDARRWEALFAGPGLPDCALLVDIDSADTVFSVTADGFEVVLREPFELETALGSLDRRVGLLVEVCRPCLADVPLVTPPWYQASIALWDAALRDADGEQATFTPTGR